jgi:hypothetical protein
VVVLLRYALIVKLKIIIGVQIIIGAVLSVSITANVFGLCVVALSRKLKLTTTLDRVITQNPCYVSLNLTK